MQPVDANQRHNRRGLRSTWQSTGRSTTLMTRAHWSGETAPHTWPALWASRGLAVKAKSRRKTNEQMDEYRFRSGANGPRHGAQCADGCPEGGTASRRSSADWRSRVEDAQRVRNRQHHPSGHGLASAVKDLVARQRTLGAPDWDLRHAVGELADREQVAPGGIDLEAARLLLGRHAAGRGERAVGRIDLKAVERARGPLRGAQEPAVGRDMQIGGRWLALEIRRQRAHGLVRREFPGAGTR